jgi:hypothetical protein
MKLTPEQLHKIERIQKMANEISNLMEDLRPAGGFKEYLDEGYCKECFRKKQVYCHDCTGVNCRKGFLNNGDCKSFTPK